MALLQIPLDQITEAHLNQLIATGASESRYVDYKQATYGTADKDHAEFRADITSFANTAGGDIIIGMAESKGVPTKIVPFTGDVDAEKLRLESMARGGIELPMVGVGVASVPVAGGHVLVVRAPRSFLKPHRVTFGGRNRFWMRSSAQKFEPNVQELRKLFEAGAEFADRARMFREDRLATIRSLPPIPIPAANALFVMHVVPLSAFDPMGQIDMRRLQGIWQEFAPPGRSSPAEHTLNFDGLLTLASFNRDVGVYHAYVQVFRNGIVEAVASIESSTGYIEAARIDGYIVNYAHAYMKAPAGLGVEPPFAIQVSLMGVNGKEFLSGHSGLSPEFVPLPIGRDTLSFSEIVLETRPPTLKECGEALSAPLRQQLWNCAGFLQAQLSFGK